MTHTRRKIVVLSGAGISAESGISTFRDSNGLWENHRIKDVATPEGWRKDKALVLKFYNDRRALARKAQPNAGHLALAELERTHDVCIITQNVDDLHERAGSTNVLHLHGSLFESRSTVDPSLIYKMDHDEIKVGDKCEKGSQLRPNIVWFNESVPAIEKAEDIAFKAEAFIVVGTSLNVYPAAGLYTYVQRGVPIYLVDPKNTNNGSKFICINEIASVGLPKVIKQIHTGFHTEGL